MKISKSYSNINLPSLNENQLKEIDDLKAKRDEDINLEDIPELTSEQMKTGHFYYANSIKMPKTSIHLMIDNDNLEWLKSEGKGYQPKLNNVLRWAKLNNCPLKKM